MVWEIDSYSVALLDNLDSEVTEADLDDSLRIVRLDLISDPRAEELLGKSAISTSLEIRGKAFREGEPVCTVPCVAFGGAIISRIAVLSNHVLEWKFKGQIPDPFNSNYDRHRPQKLFTDAVTSLRLMKPGLVGRLPTQNIILGDPSGPEGHWSSSEDLFYQPSSMNWPERYKLKVGEVNTVRSLFAAIKDCSDTRIRVALSRFNRQYARDNESDRLIDLIVGFEALYLRENDELSMHLSSRVATHLGNKGDTNRTKKKIYDCMSAAYSLRSKCVHGALRDISDRTLLKKGGWDSSYRMLEQLSSLLREAICNVLLKIDMKDFKKTFTTQLDERLFDDWEHN